jgi:hypothetical protein
MSSTRVKALLCLQFAFGRTLAAEPTEVPRTDVADQRCTEAEEQLANLLAAHGKRIIVLEGAIEPSACERPTTRPIDQTRVAHTRSHVVIFGAQDDIPAFLELAEQNAKVLEEVLADPRSRHIDMDGITPNFAGANQIQVMEAVGTLCRLSGTVESADASKTDLNPLTAVSPTAVRIPQFCLGAADYFAVFGISLRREGPDIIGHRMRPLEPGR